jgi:hypothetical protein
MDVVGGGLGHRDHRVGAARRGAVGEQDVAAQARVERPGLVDHREVVDRDDLGGGAARPRHSVGWGWWTTSTCSSRARRGSSRWIQ